MLLGLLVLAGCDQDTSFTNNTFIANKTRELKDGNSAVFTIYSVPSSCKEYHVTKLRLPNNFGNAADHIYFTTNGVMMARPVKGVLFQIDGHDCAPSSMSDLTPQGRQDSINIEPFDFTDNRAQIIIKAQDVPAAQKHQASYTFQHTQPADTNATVEVTIVLAENFGECGDYVRCNTDGSITTTNHSKLEVERNQ